MYRCYVQMVVSHHVVSGDWTRGPLGEQAVLLTAESSLRGGGVSTLLPVDKKKKAKSPLNETKAAVCGRAQIN